MADRICLQDITCVFQQTLAGVVPEPQMMVHKFTYRNTIDPVKEDRPVRYFAVVAASRIGVDTSEVAGALLHKVHTRTLDVRVAPTGVECHPR